MNETKAVSIQKFALNLGITAAVIRILIDILPKTLDLSPTIWFSTFIIAFILEVIYVIWGIKKFKKINLHLTLKDAVQIGIIIMMTIGLLFSIWSYIFDTLIDPEFTMRKTVELYESFSPEAAEMAQEQFENADKSNAWTGIFMTFLWFVFIGAIISLIGGSVLRSKEPK